MDYSIHFPNLNIHLNPVIKSISIGNFEIAMYGIVIAIGMLAGLGVACWMAKRTGQNKDTYFDLAIIAIILSVIGARIYYVIFQWDYYKDNLLSIFNLREGGLAIYGGVIAAILTTFVFCKVKKLNYALVCDTAGLGLLTGQIIGRWGNFFNREVFGEYTNNLFAMQLPVQAVREADISPLIREHIVMIDGVSFIQVHPTFLYESLWNLGLLIILILYTKHKKFDGEVFLMYMVGYGIARFWIEGIRTDQLKLPFVDYPVSQALAAIVAVGGLIWIAVVRTELWRKGRNEAEIEDNQSETEEHQ